MRAFRPAAVTVLIAALSLAAGALPAHAAVPTSVAAAPPGPSFADPRTPHCESPWGSSQRVVAGELTVLDTTCSSPSGVQLGATALNGTVTMLFGAMIYRAADASLGYDKITVHLAGSGSTGPSATVFVIVEP